MTRKRWTGRGWAGSGWRGHALQARSFLSSHPTDEDLLAFLDGELDGRALTRIRSHLEACWRCRGRRDRFNQVIAAFVDARLDDSARREGFPPSAALQLSARLDDVDARATRPSVWRRMFWHARAVLAWRPTPARFAQACVAGLTLVVIVWSIAREPSVSAQELLARTAAAQEARLRPVPHPVVYQRLQVSRRSATGPAGARETQQTWEIWSDTVHGRYRERVGAFAPIARRAALDPGACHARMADEGAVAAPTPIRELESILCANGLPSAQLLSARAYREWRGHVRGVSDRVEATEASHEGPAALVLHTTLSEEDRPMRIREAALVVRAEDWHPLAQRFTVRIDRESVTYELRELSFEVVALATVAPTFFDERLETAAPTAAAPPPAVGAVNEADVIAAEVQAWETLHRLGALLGEPVEIVRAPASPRVEVRGLASSPERKQAIVDAVSAIPLVTVDVRTVDEALTATPHAAASRSDASMVVQTGAVPIQPLIEAYLQAQRETTAFAYAGGVGGRGSGAAGASQAFATEIVSLSRDAMTEAWALERLARFTQGLDRSAVRLSARRTLERMAAELAEGTAAKLDALERRVHPIVAPVLDVTPTSHAEAAPNDPRHATGRDDSAGDDGEWPRLALWMFARVREADELTRRLFTESNAGPVELGPAAHALIEACAAARQHALTLRERLTTPVASPIGPGRHDGGAVDDWRQFRQFHR